MLSLTLLSLHFWLASVSSSSTDKQHTHTHTVWRPRGDGDDGGGEERLLFFFFFFCYCQNFLSLTHARNICTHKHIERETHTNIHLSSSFISFVALNRCLIVLHCFHNTKHSGGGNMEKRLTKRMNNNKKRISTVENFTSAHQRGRKFQTKGGSE